VSIDEAGVRLQFDDGSDATLGWDEIREVDLLSARRLPFGTDIALFFLGPGDKALPILYDELPLNWLEEIHRLPGFDLDRPWQAYRRLQRTHGVIVCWSRAAQADPVSPRPA
jgi:hypothetical protein